MPAIHRHAICQGNFCPIAEFFCRLKQGCSRKLLAEGNEVGVTRMNHGCLQILLSVPVAVMAMKYLVVDGNAACTGIGKLTEILRQGTRCRH